MATRRTSQGGARLEFHVAELRGTVQREVCEFVKGKGIVRKTINVPAGFMVYFPRGHAIRLGTKAELAKYRLDRRPKIINMQGLYDPNSPLGEAFLSADENTRKHGQERLKEAVMNFVTAVSGPVLLPEQLARKRRAQAEELQPAAE